MLGLIELYLDDILDDRVPDNNGKQNYIFCEIFYFSLFQQEATVTEHNQFPVALHSTCVCVSHAENAQVHPQNMCTTQMSKLKL